MPAAIAASSCVSRTDAATRDGGSRPARRQRAVDVRAVQRCRITARSPGSWTPVTPERAGSAVRIAVDGRDPAAAVGRRDDPVERAPRRPRAARPSARPRRPGGPAAPRPGRRPTGRRCPPAASAGRLAQRAWWSWLQSATGRPVPAAPARPRSASRRAGRGTSRRPAASRARSPAAARAACAAAMATHATAAGRAGRPAGHPARPWRPCPGAGGHR